MRFASVFLSFWHMESKGILGKLGVLRKKINSIINDLILKSKMVEIRYGEK